MPETAFSKRLRELRQHRAACVKDLRALADILESTHEEQFPTPELYVTVYNVSRPRADNPYAWEPTTLADVHMAMAASPGDWQKTAYADETWYAKKIGSAISVSFPVDRSTTCTRVKTGTRHVEAVPAHDVDVFEWQCPGTNGVTNTQIKVLRFEALAAGDPSMARICDRALDGNAAAREMCAQALGGAAARAADDASPASE